MGMTPRFKEEPDGKICLTCLIKRPLECFKRRLDAEIRNATCRSCSNASDRRGYETHRAKRIAKANDWNKANRAHRAARERARRRTSPAAALHARISAGIRAGIGQKKNSQKAFELVGYTKAELMAHLERQFTKGMSWSNLAGWHVDHIIPVSSFTVTGPDDPEFKRAWGLANLRPLWASDNISKGARIHSLL